MKTMADYLRAEGRQEGRQEGREAERLSIAKNMLKPRHGDGRYINYDRYYARRTRRSGCLKITLKGITK